MISLRRWVWEATTWRVNIKNLHIGIRPPKVANKLSSSPKEREGRGYPYLGVCLLCSCGIFKSAELRGVREGEGEMVKWWNGRGVVSERFHNKRGGKLTAYILTGAQRFWRDSSCVVLKMSQEKSQLPLTRIDELRESNEINGLRLSTQRYEPIHH